MKPSEAIQYCLDQFGNEMWSDKRENVYKALTKAKQQEAFLEIVMRNLDKSGMFKKQIEDIKNALS